MSRSFDGERWRLCLVRFLFWETTGGWLPCGECPTAGTRISGSREEKTMKFIEAPEQLTVRLFDGVTSAGVYAGGLSCLRPVELKWRTESMYGLDLTGEPE